VYGEPPLLPKSRRAPLLKDGSGARTFWESPFIKEKVPTARGNVPDVKAGVVCGGRERKPLREAQSSGAILREGLEDQGGKRLRDLVNGGQGTHPGDFL